jgi:hypothetical protein
MPTDRQTVDQPLARLIARNQTKLAKKYHLNRQLVMGWQVYCCFSHRPWASLRDPAHNRPKEKQRCT